MISQDRSVISILILSNCLFLLLGTVVHSSTGISKSKPKNDDWKITVCPYEEFQCRNGRCIAEQFICDGLLDCSDGSDESYDQCQNTLCDDQHFKCHYGACIDEKYQCDGLKQCIDGSDESPEMCNATDDEVIRRKRNADARCAIPSPSQGTTIAAVQCPPGVSCDLGDGYVTDFTVITLNCSEGYGRGLDNEGIHHCFRQKWSPKISTCLKICDKLNPENVKLQCNRDGINIPCDEKSVLLEGTKVRPSCTEAHTYRDSKKPDYFEITCQTDGKWDHVLFSCMPQCGQTFKNSAPLIAGGKKESLGDSPWHVAIYNEDKNYVCGGTIISAHLVITAAHCFYVDERSENKSPNITDYEVVVGKNTINYSVTDDTIQKAHKIKEVRFSDKNFKGQSNGFQADIAIIVLNEKISISLSVLPVCIDWVSLRDGEYPEDNAMGKVSGWGKNEHGHLSKYLMTIDLPFLSHTKCQNIVPVDFKPFITFDKFCAGFNETITLLEGDSGGGFLFQKNGLYYLHGIVSVKQKTQSGIVAFTDLIEHIRWISKVRSDVENNLKSNEDRAYYESTTNAMITRNTLKSRENTKPKITSVPPVSEYTTIHSPPKICNKLNSENVNLHCYREGIEIPCDRNPGHLPGTVVRPSCKRAYKYNGNTPPNYLEITCNEDGKWDNALFSCIPECGKTYINPNYLSRYGTQKLIGDSPWHVALYNEQKVLICGGTIISLHLVLTAAHCFQTRDNYTLTNITNNYEIVVGKFSRAYNKKDNDFQKVFKIKDIRFSDKGFFGLKNYFENDIAILILQEKLDISSAIQPACIQWARLKNGIQPHESTMGKTVGWGLNAQRMYSENLTRVDLPYISRTRCLRIIPDDFKTYITWDKFCAGFEDGLGVQPGDSGNGYLIQENDLYYLQGIVSVRPVDGSIAGLTDLSKHINWISAVHDEIETNSIQKYSPGIMSTTTITSSSTFSTPVKITTPQTSTEATKIALQNCEKYAQYRYVKRFHSVQMAGRKGIWENVTDCVNVAPLIAGGIQAKPKEYPHMALIGYGSNYNEVTWACGGSLISEKFILSAAHCSKNSPLGSPRWVLLGDLDYSSKKDNARPALYEIVRVYDHPKFDVRKLHNNIALFELNTTTVMSQYVRPACLYTSFHIPNNIKGSITGWGLTGAAQIQSKHLLKATIPILNDELCIQSYNTANRSRYLYDSTSMICAGDLNDGKDTCSGDSGGPLQIPLDKQVCMWNILGISSFGPGVCGNLEDPSPYTKVAFYLDWIQSIVWP